MRNEVFWDWFDSFAAPKLSKSKALARDGTFRKMFEHLDTFAAPIIVETGCIEDEDNWEGNGCSTILFNKYVETHPKAVAYSFEIDKEKVNKAELVCPHVHFYAGDSVELIKEAIEYLDTIDLLYLDASHHSWINEVPSQVHHYNEMMAAMPRLREDSLVVVDDSTSVMDDHPKAKITGKGGLVAQYALEVGAEMRFCHYQVGFTQITNTVPKSIIDIEKLIQRARQHYEKGELEASDRLYYLVLMASPFPWTGPTRVARGEAAAMFARTAHRMRKYGVAVDWFRTALEADPIATQYRCELVTSLVALGALDFARREASIATQLDPTECKAWQILGGVESDRMDAKAAIEAYDKQIETTDKNDPYALSDAYINRAVIALDTKDYETTRKMCGRIRELKVREGDAYQIIAMLEYRLSNHELAIKWFDKAIELGGRNQPIIHWNKALPLESIGRLKEAGNEKSWNEKEMTVMAIYVPQHRFMKPKWKGEGPITDGRKTILHIHVEAGHGDNISMLRYFPILLERGYEVHYECDPKLLSLVKYNFPDVVVMPRCKDYPGVVGIQPFDYHLPIGDLIHAMGTDINTIPWNGPYIKADPEISKHFWTALWGVCPKKQKKIGLCWSSGIRRNISIWMERYGKMKSMHFNNLAPLLDRDNAYFFPLQVGDGREEMFNLQPDLLGKDPDWAETAAFIEHLDLVITVDTGVAHLAAAMGKPTWVMMMRDGSSWHFMCYREGAGWNEKSPWYPSIRVFRQPTFVVELGWEDVVNDVNEALEEWLLP